MGGFKIRGVHLNLHQRRVDRLAATHYRNGGVPEAAFVVHYAMNWVYAGTFDDHEWVSESILALQEEEVMGKESRSTKTVSHVWCNGACCGSPRPHG